MDRHSTLKNGLVAAWCPSLGVGSVIQDRARNHNGIATAVTPRAMPGGTALEFNGSTSVVTNSTARFALQGATYASQSIWMWKPAANTACAAGFSNGTVATGGKRFGAIWFSDGVVYVLAEPDAGGSYGTYANNVAGWMHLVILFDGTAATNASRLRVFINGVQSTATGFQGTIPSSLSSDLGDYTLGKDSSNRFVAGRLDDVRLYRRVLTQAEIALLASRRGIGLTPTRHRRGSALAQFWLNVAGTWKAATPWINVGGTWKKGSPKLRASGAWKG